MSLRFIFSFIESGYDLNIKFFNIWLTILATTNESEERLWLFFSLTRRTNLFDESGRFRNTNQKCSWHNGNNSVLRLVRRERKVLNICCSIRFIIAYLIVIQNSCNFRNSICRRRVEYWDYRASLDVQFNYKPHS